MSPACLFIEDDLSLAAVCVDGACETWRPTPAQFGADRASADTPDGEGAAAQEQAAALAVWVRERVARGRRLRLCVGVRRAVCERVKAPSADPAVVAAAIAQRDEDAADRLASITIEPLPIPAAMSSDEDDVERARRSDRFSGLRRLLDRGRSTVREAAAVTVIESPTAAVRLTMDALERAGRPVADVITHWHALLMAFPPPARFAAPAPTVNGAAGGAGASAEAPAATPAEAHAVVQVDRQGALLWAWGVDTAPLTGGCAAARRAAPSALAAQDSSLGAAAQREPAEPPPQAADSARLLLDWITWSAQLGVSPARASVVGPTAGELADRLRQAWPGVDVRTVECDDPLIETLERIAPALDASGVDDGSRAPSSMATVPLSASRFEALTRRPSRRRRRAGLWWSAAFALIGVAGAVDGGRNLLSARAHRAAAESIRADVRRRAIELGVSPAEATAPVRALLGRLQTAQAAFKPPAPPPPPRPIREELVRLVGAVASVEGATLEKVSLEAMTGLATVSVPSVEVGERVQFAIRQAGGQVRWSGQFMGVAPALTLRLTAQWEPSR